MCVFSLAPICQVQINWLASFGLYQRFSGKRSQLVIYLLSIYADWVLTSHPQSQILFHFFSHQTWDVYIHILRLRHKYHIVLSYFTTFFSKCNFQHVISQKLEVYKEIVKKIGNLMHPSHFKIPRKLNKYICIYNLLPDNEVLISMFTFIYIQLRLQPIINLLMSLSFLVACDHFISLQ